MLRMPGCPHRWYLILGTVAARGAARAI